MKPCSVGINRNGLRLNPTAAEFRPLDEVGRQAAEAASAMDAAAQGCQGTSILCQVPTQQASVGTTHPSAAERQSLSGPVD